MTSSPRPNLEDLRVSPDPAWLWDAGRRRIVWANAPGLKVFGCGTLFELVDRPFDGKDPGVERLAGLANDLSWGQQTKALLHFPSSGAAAPFHCSVFVHALADGRPGLLAILESGEADDAAKQTEASHQVLDTLPIAALVLGADGVVVHANPMMMQLIGGRGPTLARDLLGERSETLLAAARAGLVEESLAIRTASGVKTLKTRLSSVSSFGQGKLMLILEDQPVSVPPRSNETAVPERKAAPKSSGEAITSKEEAFAALSKSLSETLNGEARASRPGAAHSMQQPSSGTVAFAPLPLPVQHTLEQAPYGIVVCRNGEALFATARAASMLGHGHAPAIIADTNVLAELASVPAGVSTVLDLQRPGVAPLLVTRLPLPWHNGPAEQFTLKPYDGRIEAAPAPANSSEAADAPAKAAPKPQSIAAAAAQTSPPQLASEKPAAVAPVTGAVTREVVANDELRAILDVASDGIITLDKDGDILSFSAAAEAIFGMTSGEAAGRALRDLLHADSRRALRDYLAGLSSPGLAAIFNDGREMTAINAQGGEIPLFMTIGRLQSPRSQAAFCAVVRDLTPWKKTERELVEAREKAEAASRQKSDFLARISHELRTPLNAILGFSDVMRTQRFGAIGNDKYLAYANDIHASGSHLLSVVNDLLDLSKVEAGKLELDFMAVNLEDVVDYAIHMLQGEAANAGVLLRKSIVPGLPRVVGDQKSLRQIVINLISNGVKYTDTGGEVLVSASLQENGALVLRVKDTGIGMSAAQLEEALQPFGRVEMGARQRPGTGLGLPLTKSLVEANRARFNLASTPGKGTLAEISFPGPRVLAE